VGEAPRHRADPVGAAASRETTGPFVWGVATSAYQVEGAAINDWTEWERRGRLKDPSTRCGRAAGHAERWRSDFALLPTIGANAYRLSIEWSALEPRPGEFDEDELSMLARRVRSLRGLGVEPVVTLHHYTHPLWFWEEGGWESAGSIRRFARLAGAVAGAVGGEVRRFVTLNEPIVFLLAGYIAGEIPPGLRCFSAAARAFENLLRAHRAASDAIRERIPDARISIAHNMLDFAPDRPGRIFDRRLTAAGERLYNRALLEALATGLVDWDFPGEGRTRFRIEALPASVDEMGVNYYSRVHLRYRGFPVPRAEFFYRDPDARGRTQTGWEVHPSGFERVLREASKAGLPVLVLENGIATLDDRLRCDFLREHALVLGHAIASGIPIRGYFYWSLLDNFEWLEGFRPRFGLFEVDYGTFGRRRRPSADLFAVLGRRFVGGAPGAQEAGR
jgi:beta-glucosidase